jgi:acyl carrier protein
VVIGASVLHAARRLDVSIGHLARLVAPGGALVLIEATRLLPVLQLVMALQPGFDSFEDTELRPEHCLVDSNTWAARLTAGGFDEVKAFARPGSLADRTGVMVIVARRSTAPAQVELPQDNLRLWLAERLPEPMVPTTIVTLSALPISANGKVDRAALPVPRDEQAVTAPRTAMERAVVTVWGEVLGLAEVSVTEPFFALGGDSLSAVRVASRLSEGLGVEVPLRLLLTNPDAATLAATLSVQAPQTMKAVVAHEAAGRYEPFPLTDVQRAYWMGRSDGVALGGVSAWIYLELETDLLDISAWESAWQMLIEVHDALRTVVLPDGRQQVLRQTPTWRLPVVALRGEPDANERALALRHSVAQQLRSPERWPLFDLRAVTLGTEDQPTLRLCFGLDVIAADGWSLMGLLRQWGEVARSGVAPKAPGLTFRDVVLHNVSEEGSPVWEADRAWWRARLDSLPPGPTLPLVADAEGASSRFVRRLARLDTARWSRLQTRAARRGLTPATALLTAYAAVIGAFSASPEFTLNLTLFDRPPIHPDIESVVGDAETRGGEAT